MRVIAMGVAAGLVLVSLGCGGGGSKAAPTQPPPATAASLVVSPSSATLALGTGRQFSVKASSGTTPAVTWSVEGVAGGNAAVGTITAGGFYTAPDKFPADNKVTITATATANSNQRGKSSVTVVYPNTNAKPEDTPIKLGTSGGNNTDLTATLCCSGTLGALLRRDGDLFILSNNHVLAKSDKGDAGDPIGQPGLADNNCSAGKVVAHLTQKAPLQSSNVDAAIGKIVDGQVATSGSILALGPAGSTSIAAAPPSSTLADPATVMSSNTGVAKSGRSTGLTCSALQSVSTSVSVDYDGSCGGAKAFTVTFHGQVVVGGGSFSAGGDSGSLVVTSDNARPVALLFAGNDTSTVANPIQDVLQALQNSTTKSLPTIVGGSDHGVSCAPTATVQSAAAPAGASAPLSTGALARAMGVKEKWAASLMSDPAISGVGVGHSDDQPGEPAIVVYLSGATLQPVPREIEGVRTKVIRGTTFTARSEQAAGGTRPLALERDEFQRGLAAKERNAPALLQQAGIVGVGVGRSDDAPGETAMIIYVERGKAHAAIPATIDGVRTRVVAGERFRAFRWNEKTSPPRACKISR
ncbi:MAG TPA: hypothetical protein VLA96_03025 [Terriglobales bacterium]|nr:hypothetical protein [Terriglobales bacterium]